jgi:transposase
MSKYSLETKLEAVHAYLEGVESFQRIAEKYNVNISLLKEWVAKFRENGREAFPETYTKYSTEFKMDVLTYMKETGASSVKASSVFNIPSARTVRKWQHLWETQGIDALRPKKKGRPFMKKKAKKPQPTKTTEEALRAENEQLRMENAYLKKLHALIQEKEKSANKTKRKSSMN